MSCSSQTLGSVRNASSICLLVVLLGVCRLPAAGANRISVTAVRYWSLGEVTRVAVETDGEFSFKFRRLTNPERIYFDILNSTQRVAEETPYVIQVNDGLVKQIRVAQNMRTVTRIVLDLDSVSEVTSSQLANPNRLMIEVRGAPRKPRTSELRKLPEPVKTATTSPEKSKVKPSNPPPAVAKKAPSLPKEPEPESAKAETVPETGTPDSQSAKPVQTAAAPKEAPKPAPPKVKETAKLEIPRERKAAPKPEAEKPVSKPPVAGSESAKKEPEKQAEEAVPSEEILIAKPAESNSGGGRSLTRVLGLKMTKVVLDPGHGGRDTGTIGPTGLREKDIVLDVAKRLKKLIENGMGSEVVLTRTGDTSLSLDDRTRLANENKADLFLSIHVNASRYKSVSGVETFYLNFTQSRADLEVAARENAGSDKSIHELSDLVRKIALDDKLQESKDFASSVHKAVHRFAKRNNSKARDRGLKKAPFIVLIGAQMPSVLVELGFISNAGEERQMKRPAYRQQVAEALYEGLSDYAATLSHFQITRTNGGD